MWSLYEQEEFEKALEVFERVGDSGEVPSRDAKSAGGFYEFRPFILAELPDGPSRALEAYRGNCKRFTEGSAVISNLATLLFLGKRKEAMNASRELLTHPERLTSLNSEHNLRILKYLGGDISEGDFLEAEAGSRGNECEAHFYVALDRLSQGDRAGTREHFQKSLAAGSFSLQWSRPFLKRMDQDPNWPPWIPLQEPATQPTPNPRQ
jgi:hypothetical protein